jgi:hypothetical protein
LHSKVICLVIANDKYISAIFNSVVTEPQRLIALILKPVTGHNPKPVIFNPHPHSLSMIYYNVILFSFLLPVDIFPKGFLARMVYIFLVSHPSYMPNLACMTSLP